MGDQLFIKAKCENLLSSALYCKRDIFCLLDSIRNVKTCPRGSGEIAFVLFFGIF